MTNSPQAYNHRALEQEVGFSQAVLAGGFLFISGCVSWDKDGTPVHVGDLASQITAVYADIDATLKANGMDASNIVKETVYTTDIDGLGSMNSRRLAYYDGVTPPASTWIEITRLAHPDLLLEIEIMAYKAS